MVIINDIIIDDVFIYITTFLNNKDKMAFLSTSQHLNFLKNKIYYNTYVRQHKICNLPYYDRFTNIGVCDITHRLPLVVTNLSFNNDFYHNYENKEDFKSVDEVNQYVDKLTAYIKEYIPNSVKYISFGHLFEGSIKNCVPDSVTHLSIGECLWHSSIFDIDSTQMHDNTNNNSNNSIMYPYNDTSNTSNIFNNRCKQINQKLKENIPNSVTHLDFYFSVDSEDIRQSIPKSITTNPTSNFISNITHLTFNWQFNQDVRGCIPNSVTHLTFGYSFNQNIKDCIPNSVTHLTFGFRFNQDITNCIPNSVSHLTLGQLFNKNIKDCIIGSTTSPTPITSTSIISTSTPSTSIISTSTPSTPIISNLTHLTLENCKTKNIKDNILNSVTANLTHLILNDNIDEIIDYGRVYTNRPPQIRYNIVDCIPKSVTHLTFGRHYNQTIEGCIPNNVTHLTLGQNFRQDIKEHHIPNSVVELRIHKDYTKKIIVHGNCEIIFY